VGHLLEITEGKVSVAVEARDRTRPEMNVLKGHGLKRWQKGEALKVLVVGYFVPRQTKCLKVDESLESPNARDFILRLTGGGAGGRPKRRVEVAVLAK